MDEASRNDWKLIYDQSVAYQQQMPQRVKDILKSFAGVSNGFPVDQLDHSLQMATRAKNEQADDEMILCCLLHDIGKAITTVNHDRIGAEILRQFISHERYLILYHHQIFQGRYYYSKIGKNPDEYLKFNEEPWFQDALLFSQWDQLSFDPDYPHLPLGSFEPLIDQFLGKYHFTWEE
jgi:putative nucleotidyltransferase with HDIG domain